jgi:hypothetical protein
MNPRTLNAILIGSLLGVLAGLSVAPAQASDAEARRAVRALERIASALERGPCR